MLAIYTDMERGWSMSAEDKVGGEEGHFLLSLAQKRSLTGQLFFADSYIYI